MEVLKDLRPQRYKQLEKVNELYKRFVMCRNLGIQLSKDVDRLILEGNNDAFRLAKLLKQNNERGTQFMNLIEAVLKETIK